MRNILGYVRTLFKMSNIKILFDNLNDFQNVNLRRLGKKIEDNIYIIE